MGDRGRRREWVLGAAMALVLGGVAAVTLALREGEAVTPPEPAPEAPEPDEPDGPPVEVPFAFLPAPLPRHLEFDESAPFAPLPARVTLMWNAATQQTKVYVGQAFVGILDQGGIEKGVDRCRQILVATPEVPIEIDAQPDLPWEQFVRAYAALRLVGNSPPMLSAGPDEIPQDLAAVPPYATWGAAPSVLCATDHPVDREWGRRGALLLSVDPVRRVVLRFGADPSPEPHGYVSLRARLAAEAAAYPDRTAAQLSRRRVALFLPPDAEYRHAQFLIQECAKVGIWDIAFAVAAPPAPK